MSNRIFYAVQAASLFGKTAGFQSVSVNASVDFEQVFELGSLQLCHNLEGVPSVEISVERVWQGAAGSFFTAAGGNTADASNARPTLEMTVADDSSANFATTSNFVKAADLYLSSWGVTFPVEGFATETCTCVGNDLQWNTGDVAIRTADANCQAFSVYRRQDVALVARAQSVSFNCDIGREDLFQLGDKYPYFRPATFPVECSSDWEYLASVGINGLTMNSNSGGDITSDTSLVYEGVTLNKARLTSTNYSGGDAGGGNATITYSYIGYNSLVTE